MVVRERFNAVASNKKDPSAPSVSVSVTTSGDTVCFVCGRRKKAQARRAEPATCLSVSYHISLTQRRIQNGASEEAHRHVREGTAHSSSCRTSCAPANQKGSEKSPIIHPAGPLRSGDGGLWILVTALDGRIDGLSLQAGRTPAKDGTYLIGKLRIQHAFASPHLRAVAVHIPVMLVQATANAPVATTLPSTPDGGTVSCGDGVSGGRESAQHRCTAKVPCK